MFIGSIPNCQKLKQPTCPSAGEWVNKLVSPSMEYHLTVTRMTGNICNKLDESQMQAKEARHKATYCMMLFCDILEQVKLQI